MFVVGDHRIQQQQIVAMGVILFHRGDLYALGASAHCHKVVFLMIPYQGFGMAEWQGIIPLHLGPQLHLTDDLAGKECGSLFQHNAAGKVFVV